MSADLFYRIMLGDVALQRGEPALAARAFYEAAREARDVDLAARAAEIALRTRQRDVAEAASKLWIKLDPDATRPKQILAAAQSGTMAAQPLEEQGGDLEARLRALIDDAVASHRGAGEIFLQVNRALAQQTDKLTAFKIVQDVARTLPRHGRGAVRRRAGRGQHRPRVGDDDRRPPDKAIDRALELKPDWDRAALLKSEILGKQSRSAAIDYLQDYTRAHPESSPASGALAQFYVEDKRPADARAVFERLWKANPDARDFEFGVAALSFQMKDWPRAEALFQDLKTAHYGENGVVELYLAQVAEEQQHYDEAITRYKAVPEGERAWIAKLRIAGVMAKKGDLAGARRYLNDLPAVTIDQRIEVRQTEAQLLRDANDNAGAYAVLTKALAEHPDSPELLYDAAMVAEKLDRIDDSEAQARARRRAEARRPAGAERARLHAGRSREACRRRLRADRARAEARAGRRVHPRQHGLGAVPHGPPRRLGRVPAARVQRARRSGDRRASGRSAVGQGRPGACAQRLAIAAPGHARQRDAAGNRAAALALMRVAAARRLLRRRAMAGRLHAGCPRRHAARPPFTDSAFAVAGRLSAHHGDDALSGELRLAAPPRHAMRSRCRRRSARCWPRWREATAPCR